MHPCNLELILLFFSGALSATFLPGSAEVVFLHTLESCPEVAPEWIWLVVSLGNTLGAVGMYAVGWLGGRYARNTWERLRQKYPRLSQWIQKYGYFTALLSPLPVVGDGIPVVLGWFRTSLVLTLVFLFAGKGIRFALLYALWRGLRFTMNL